MIAPTDHDIGRHVIYREAGTHPGRKVEAGVLTSYNERVAFVLYSGCTSAATNFADLEWRGPRRRCPETIQTVAAEFAQLMATQLGDYVLADLSKDVQSLMRDCFYAGSACSLYAVTGQDQIIIGEVICLDAKVVKARHLELQAFLDE